MGRVMPSMTDDCRSVPIPAWVRCADAAVLVLLSLAFIVFVTGGVRGKVAGIPISVTSGARFVLYALLVGGVRHLAFRGRTLLDRVASVGVLQAANTPALVRDEATAGRAVEGRAGKTEVVFVVALMAVLAVVMTYPQVRRINSVPDPGDPLFSVWRLAWIAHQLAHDPLHLFDANIFYPERHTFALSDSILLPGLVGAPFLWLGVPAVRFYNLYLIATFAFAGIAMYLFVRSLTGKWPPALVAAIVFAFYPFRALLALRTPVLVLDAARAVVPATNVRARAAPRRLVDRRGRCRPDTLVPLFRDLPRRVPDSDLGRLRVRLAALSRRHQAPACRRVPRGGAAGADGRAVPAGAADVRRTIERRSGVLQR
jgi:hypothetical protein